MVLYLRELNNLKCSRNACTVSVYQQHFFIFLLQSIEDRLKAINSASSETQRYVYVVIGGVC